MNKRDLMVNPTLACGNLLNLKKDLDILEKEGISILHIDVMDGHYVPNLCFNLNTLSEIRRNYAFLLDVHLMVTNPEDYVIPLKEIGIEYLSFHLDTVRFPIRLLKKIECLGMKGGIVLNPSQPVSLLEEVLPYLSFVLVMGVEPGFSGQTFLPQTIDKIKELACIRKERALTFMIEVDGGVNDLNTESCIKEGADILVTGAFGVFRRKNGLEQDCHDYLELVERIKR